jgi:DNA-binding MarR family transcriptional regulator
MPAGCAKLNVPLDDATIAKPHDFADAPVLLLMRVAMQRHTSIFTTYMIENLTQTQFAVMAKLHEVGLCSQNQLGRLVFLDASTVKGVVDRLRLRGFITIGRDPNDRRRRTISLTAQGSRVTKSAIRAAVDITAQTLRSVTSEERRMLTDLLKKLT